MWRRLFHRFAWALQANRGDGRMEYRKQRYIQCVRELVSLIPQNEYNAILSQDVCEYDRDFLGFIEVYKNFSQLIPRNGIVIDFGCYLGHKAISS